MSSIVQPDPDSKVYFPTLDGIVELMADRSNERDDRFLGYIAGVFYNIAKDHEVIGGFGCHVCRGDYSVCPRLDDAEAAAIAWLIQEVTHGA